MVNKERQKRQEVPEAPSLAAYLKAEARDWQARQTGAWSEDQKREKVKIVVEGIPRQALTELKHKHKNMSAWIRKQIKAEVGPENWPEEQPPQKKVS